MRLTNPSSATIPDPSLPLGYLDLIVRPNGLMAIVEVYQEAVLTQLCGAREASLPWEMSTNL
jgi:hypothetical protein